MADWAGGYGAGGAAQALQDLVAQQFLVRKQAEIERANRAAEQAETAARAQRGDEFRQLQGMQMQNFVAERDERYQDQLRRKDERTEDIGERQKDRDARAAERKADLEARNADREDEQAFRAGETRSRQAFERSLMGMRDSSSSEPLVAIKDPATGQPRLVPRSQAVGATPASTRDQALTEGQSNAAGFADRMKFNEQHIQGFETDATRRINQVQGWLPGELQSDKFQGYQSAKLNWIAANLRKESGAAIGKDEYANADQQYFPQPGDGAAVVAQKRQLRAVAEAAMRRSSGFAGAEGEMAAPAAPPAAGPAPGTRGVINGQPAVWDGRGWLPAPASKPAGAAELFSSRR